MTAMTERREPAINGVMAYSVIINGNVVMAARYV